MRRRVLEIPARQAEAHVLLGVFRSCLDYDWQELQRRLEIARQLDPDGPEIALRCATDYLWPQGRIAEAMSELQRGLEFDPASVFIRFYLGVTHIFARDFARAIEQFQFLVALAPERHPELRRALELGHFGMGMAHMCQGHFEEAVRECRRSVELSSNWVRLSALGLALGLSGRRDEARAMLERLRTVAAREWVPPMCFAWTHMGLGETDTALTWMERAVEESDPPVLIANRWPGMEWLESNSRFAALRRRMNLQDA